MWDLCTSRKMINNDKFLCNYYSMFIAHYIDYQSHAMYMRDNSKLVQTNLYSRNSVDTI